MNGPPGQNKTPQTQSNSTPGLFSRPAQGSNAPSTSTGASATRPLQTYGASRMQQAQAASAILRSGINKPTTTQNAAAGQSSSAAVPVVTQPVIKVLTSAALKKSSQPQSVVVVAAGVNLAGETSDSGTATQGAIGISSRAIVKLPQTTATSSTTSTKTTISGVGAQSQSPASNTRTSSGSQIIPGTGGLGIRTSAPVSSIGIRPTRSLSSGVITRNIQNRSSLTQQNKGTMTTGTGVPAKNPQTPSIPSPTPVSNVTGEEVNTSKSLSPTEQQPPTITRQPIIIQSTLRQGPTKSPSTPVTQPISQSILTGEGNNIKPQIVTTQVPVSTAISVETTARNPNAEPTSVSESLTAKKFPPQAEAAQKVLLTVKNSGDDKMGVSNPVIVQSIENPAPPNSEATNSDESPSQSQTRTVPKVVETSNSQASVPHVVFVNKTPQPQPQGQLMAGPNKVFIQTSVTKTQLNQTNALSRHLQGQNGLGSGQQQQGRLTPIQAQTSTRNILNANMSTGNLSMSRPLQQARPLLHSNESMLNNSSFSVPGNAHPGQGSFSRQSFNDQFLVSPKSSPIPIQSVKQKRVVMRLRSKFRSLQEAYLKEGRIFDQDTDVTFCCGDGGRVKGHKVILASVSTFFTDVFQDQKSGKMTMVMVPDVPSDIMKILLTLAYKDNVIVTQAQMQDIKEYGEVFGMRWEQLKPERAKGGMRLDVRPGRIIEAPSPQKPPPPLMAKPPHQVPTVPTGLSPQRRMTPYFGSPRSHGQSSGSQTPTKMQDVLAQKRSMSHLTGSRSNLIPRQRQRYEHDRQKYSDTSEVSDPEFELQGYGGSEPHQERRKSKLTPRVETETDDLDENDLTNDPVVAQRMIKTWLSQLGKANTDDSEPEVKRPRLEPSRRAPQNAKYECTVCSATFEKENAWRWHEDRHVGLGLFKCTQCDDLLKTGRAVWVHEQNHHDFVAIDLGDLEEQRGIPSNFQVVENRRQPTSKLTRSPGTASHRSSAAPARQQNQKMQFPQAGGSRNIAALRMAHLKRIKASKSAAKKIPEVKPQTATLENNSGAEVEQSESPESVKKIKQLHWLYVCAKCDNCADSHVKAVNHYNKCYKDQEAEFNLTVTKYRQGYYGKSKCPMCPRRFAANGGFMIHCGHTHQDYRRLFSHTGAAEDKLKCVNCQRKFALPDEFHEHLENGVECSKSPINEESMPLLSSSRSGSGTPSERNKRRTLVSTRSSIGTEDASPVVTPVMAPRSARLANRLSVARKALAEGEESKTLPITRVGSRRGSGPVPDYPPADCPICGASEVPNISQHLTSDHEDLNVSVHRLSAELLRCRKCTITFAICDLLAHTNTCTPIDNSAQESHSTDSNNSNEPKKPSTSRRPREAPVVLNKDEFPPEIGTSPVDQVLIDIKDLCNRETLRKGLTCGVCGKMSVKFGDISICLKSHGVYRCALCFNSYYEKNDYSEHMKICHSSETSSNKLKCPLCPRDFINAGQVTGHMYTSHWVGPLQELKQELRKYGQFSLGNDNATGQDASSTAGAEETDVETRINSEIAEGDKMELEDVTGVEETEQADPKDNLNPIEDSQLQEETETGDADGEMEVLSENAETSGEVNDSDNNDLQEEEKTGE